MVDVGRLRATVSRMSVFDRAEPLKRLVETGRAAAKRVGERVLSPLQNAATNAIQSTGESALQEGGPEPPVVARLMVEIRSDGSKTIARGALEDLMTGQKVAVRADGTSPAQLARSLASTLIALPAFATRIARSLKGDGSGED